MIVNLIRVIIGLNPIGEYDSTLQEMVYEAINIDEVEQPVISVIEQACSHCDKNYEKNETCLVKKKHTDCNEKNICSACGDCINKCDLGAISDKIQFIPMIKLLKDHNKPVYAIVAPAFVGQFGENITPGKLRTGLKKIGFEEMIEVSLAADMLTVKEAYDYCEHIEGKESEYFITSCCCPVWVSLIQKDYPEILRNVSPSVSPMIACGRAIKILNSKAKVVFIGPCIAKKKEATLEDIKDAVDFVLTFTEVEEIFKALNINLQEIGEEDRVESSYSGRIYGKSGGVSKAIELSTKRINQNIKFEAVSFQGVKECKEGLDKVINKELGATFIEGMGCIGGCVGGPKRIVSAEKGIEYITKYGESTEMETPYENLNVVQFLTMMGIKRLESLGKKEEEQVLKIFSRDINKKK
ncbi:[Fe-Fe] hydrogenase large subunit C-terminal domain-containing protein [Romboutsia sp.]|uniref:[Fe-Fe] hydrogenase large subunit C-terminal domain-containing protein n=1 Tax=Romboutsia sp. TaxID=1965302 RepID=UPI003F39D3E9